MHHTDPTVITLMKTARAYENSENLGRMLLGSFLMDLLSRIPDQSRCDMARRVVDSIAEACRSFKGDLLLVRMLEGAKQVKEDLDS